MTWLALLLVGAVISGNEAVMTSIQHTELQKDVLAKGMLLQTFSLFMQRMYDKEANEKGEEIVKGITKQKPQDDTEAVAAIYDRYVSFRLTINYLACLHFYKVGAAVPEAGEAEGCDEYAKYVIWFNQQFSAREFYEQLQNTGQSDADYNLKQVVEYLEILYERQNLMVTAFEKSGENTENPYVDVFQRMKQSTENSPLHPTLPEEYANPIAKEAVQRGEVEDKFRTEALERFYTFFGPELLYVENYWNLFFSHAAKRTMVSHVSHMVREPLVEEDAQRSHFKVMEESNLEPTIFNFQNAHEVQYAGLLYYGLEMRVRNIAEVLPPKQWEIKPAESGSLVDFYFEFLQDPLEGRGAATSTSGAREGGGPGSSSGGGGPGSSSGGGADILAGGGYGASEAAQQFSSMDTGS